MEDGGAALGRARQRREAGARAVRLDGLAADGALLVLRGRSGHVHGQPPEGRLVDAPLRTRRARGRAGGAEAAEVRQVGRREGGVGRAVQEVLQRL